MFDYDTLYPVVLAKMFPDPAMRQQCELILARYGVEEYHREEKRVRLAILNLAGPDLEALERNLGYALADYRDVLAWAEYPQAIRTDSWRLPADSPERKHLRHADRRQYREWVASLLAPEGGNQHGQES